MRNRRRNRRPSIYRFLLRLVPLEFRMEYGPEMVRTHRERVALRTRRGRPAPLLFFLFEYFDLIRTAAREWRNHLQPAPTRPSREPGLTMHRRNPDMMRTLLSDLRFSLRTLLHHPGFSLVVVLTLAIGIGATTAVFSLVDAALLDPLPFEDPDRIVALQNTQRDRGTAFNVTWNDYVTWREEDLFEQVAVYGPQQVTVTGMGEPGRMQAAFVTDQFFDALRLEPVAGRLFTPEENGPGAAGARVVVIGYGFWQRAFGGDPEAIGSTLRLEDQPCTVVGVMPPEAAEIAGIEIWAVYPRPLVTAETEWDNHAWRGLARLKTGESLPSTNAAMQVVAQRLEQEHPGQRQHIGSLAIPLLDFMLGRQISRSLWLVLGVVFFVLLVGCVNVANMQLAHASDRSHEFAVRRAMGAGRARLLRLHMSGSLLLAMAGGAAGALLAAGLVKVLLRVLPGGTPRVAEAGLDGSALLFALMVSLGAALLFGLLPGLRATSSGQQGLVAQARSRATSGRRQRRSRSVLVGVELTLSVVLLAGAGLLLRSLDNLHSADPGFEHENLLTVWISLPSSRYPDPAVTVRQLDELRQEVARLPGVEDATLRSMMALGGSGFSLWRAYLAEGWPEPPDGIELHGPWVVVGDDHFRTVGLPVVRGRAFTPSDDADSTPVMIISQEMANGLFGEEDPIGRRVRSWRDENIYREIVGVVANERMLGPGDIDRNIAYVPHRQNRWRGMALMARTAGDPHDAINPIREVIHRFDPDVPATGFSTMEEMLALSVATTSTMARLISAFAATALLLAAVGVFGVLSYVVSMRRREIGIRMAVGADGGRVQRLLLGETSRVVCVSLVIGLAGAQVLGRLLEQQLFEVTPLDPLTLLGVSALLAATTLIAILIPARRAARTNLVDVLRAE